MPKHGFSGFHLRLWAANVFAVMVLGVDSPFFPTIVLFENQLFSQGFGGCLERRIPGKNGEATLRMVSEFPPVPYGFPWSTWQAVRAATALEGRGRASLRAVLWARGLARDQHGQQYRGVRKGSQCACLCECVCVCVFVEYNTYIYIYIHMQT